MLEKKIIENWQWIGMWLFVILASIYARPLIPIDETRYLSVAWEMWQNNDFLVPHINGQPYSHKPPLLFWLIHLSWFLFGVGELSARIVAPLFGLGSLLLTVKLANLLWPEDRSVSAAAPYILLGSIIWTIYGSLTMFDTLLTFFSLLGLICILKAQKRNSILPWIGLSLSIGLGILAKGPILLLYLLPSLFLAPWWSSRETFCWKNWFNSSLIALIAGLAIAACWALPAAQAGGPEYEKAILFSQTAGRMVHAFAHDRPFYWYLACIPLLCFPWLFWLPAWKGWKRKPAEQSTRFCISALLPSFCILSFVSGKQLHYILPLLPVGAMYCARLVTSVKRQSAHDTTPLIIIFFIISLALCLLPKLSLIGGDREILQYIPSGIFVIPLCSATALMLIRPATVLGSIKTISSCMLLFVVFLQLTVADPLHAIYDQSTVGEKLNIVQKQERMVAVFPQKMSDQFQFSGRLTQPLQPIDSYENLAGWAFNHPQQYCLLFTKSPNYRILTGKGLASRYRNGWLIFRPAKDFSTDYRDWLAHSTKTTVTPAIEIVDTSGQIPTL
jgi:4-amino-4-deoxy-L-arabinose transferase-like glycosyltransferase